MIVLDRIKNFFIKVFRKVTPRISLLIVVGLCVASLLFQYFRRSDAVSVGQIVGAVVVPFQKGINEIGGFLFKTEENRLKLNEALEQIEALKDENEALKRRISEQNDLVMENEELRALLGARDRLENYEVKAATVIGRDGTTAFSRFTINLGSLDGIKADMNVINGDGLIGIVTYVGWNYAIVTSIIEDGVHVSAMTKNAHENCVVTGDITASDYRTLKLENALAKIDFTADATLVTSNISDKFLPNLLIGYAGEMTLSENGLTQSGKVKTAVDFSKLKEVLVITTLKEELKEAE